MQSNIFIPHDNNMFPHAKNMTAQYVYGTPQVCIYR